jgi:hypothetical protein
MCGNIERALGNEGVLARGAACEERGFESVADEETVGASLLKLIEGSLQKEVLKKGALS